MGQAQQATAVEQDGRRAWFVRGARDVTPILIGILPFATIAGAATAAVGASPLQSLGLSAFMFAGTAELATLELLAGSAPIGVMVVTALIINLRFAMYSASLATHLRGLPRGARAGLAHIISDQAFAVSMVRLVTMHRLHDRAWYFLGTALPLFLTWQVGHAAGYFLGASVPPKWSLEFSIPLTLLALLVGGLRDRTARWVAVSTAVVVPLARFLPLGLGLIAAIGVGIAVGVAADRRAA